MTFRQPVASCGLANEAASYLLRGKLAFVLGRVAQLFNGQCNNISLLQVRGRLSPPFGGCCPTRH